MGKRPLKLGRDEAPDAGAAGGVDEVELLVVGDGGDEEVDAAEDVVQALDVLEIYQGELAGRKVFFEFGMGLGDC